MSKHIRKTCLRSAALKMEDTAVHLSGCLHQQKTKSPCKCKMLS